MGFRKAGGVFGVGRGRVSLMSTVVNAQVFEERNGVHVPLSLNNSPDQGCGCQSPVAGRRSPTPKTQTQRKTKDGGAGGGNTQNKRKVFV